MELENVEPTQAGVLEGLREEIQVPRLRSESEQSERDSFTASTDTYFVRQGSDKLSSKKGITQGVRKIKKSYFLFGILLVVGISGAYFFYNPSSLSGFSPLIESLKSVFSPSQGGLVVNVRRSSSGGIINIHGESSLDSAAVAKPHIYITLTPVGGGIYGQSLDKLTFEVGWVKSDSGYGFDVNVPVLPMLDYTVKVDVGDYSKTFTLKSPIFSG
jgi:hypothetical protein